MAPLVPLCYTGLMAKKSRKPGDWKAIAAGRNQVPRIPSRGHGLTNIPGMNETGSAAYRRMQDKLKKH